MKDDDQEMGRLRAECTRLQETVARQQAAIQRLQQRLPLPVQPQGPFIPGLGNLDQLLLLVEKVFPAVALTDPQGRVTWVSKGFTALCGYELPELLGQPIRQLLKSSPADSATQAYLEDCRASQQPCQFEIPNPCKSRPGSWIRVKRQPLFDANKQLIMYMELLEDISEQKLAQLALAESEQRYRLLVENGPAVQYEWRENFDGTSGSTYLSPQIQTVFGFSPQQGSLIADFVHPEDRERFHHSIAKSNSLRVPWVFEGRLVVPGQPLRWFRAQSVHAGEDDKGLLYRGAMADITSSRLAQEVMRERGQRWQVALEAIGNNKWEYNCTTRKLALSPQYGDLLGYHGQDVDLVANTAWFANVTPESNTAAQHALLAYLSGKVSLFSTTYHLIDPAGQERWVLAQGMVTQRDKRGNALMVTGSLMDVTDITHAQNALLVSELRLATTIGSLEDGIMLEDENHKIILVNEAFCRIYKLSCAAHELMGTDSRQLAQQVMSQLCDEEDFIRTVQGCYAHSEPAKQEILCLKDGRTLSYDSMHIAANGRYLGYVWKVEDITQRKNEEDALRRREEKYRSILENLNLGLVEINQEGKIQFVNQSYCEISGYSEAELQGAHISQFQVSESNRELIEEKKQLRMQGISDTYEQTITTKAGELKWMLISGAPLYNDDKQYVGSIGVHLDITHQKQLAVKLRKAKKKAEASARSKEMFLANMSHEIRTPMNAILGMSQLLAKTPLSEKQDNYLHAISTSANNLLVIINDILDQSKINAGKLTIEQIGFDLRKVCEQVGKTLQYKAEDKGLSLNVQVSPDIPEVLLGDPYRLTQVLLNLAGNSIKFTEKGHVWISCELAGTLGHEVVVEFSVSDTGIGIEPEYLNALYQDFSQADASTSRKYGGTGLGLSISRNLANLMGGEIQIESEKHHGTVSMFSLLLPIGSYADLPRNEVRVGPKALRKGLRGKRVLLVEDNEYNRVLAKTFLEQAHLVVTEAENGIAAVVLAREQEFDLVLMDMQMPVMNGLEATEHLRNELGLQIPIIALTANALQGDNQKCLAAGMNDYLSKPFHEDALLKMMQDWLLHPPHPETQPPAYRLDRLKEMANNDTKFIGFMLRTFLSSAQDALATMSRALQAGEMDTLKAAAHRIKPSIAHLQILQVLTPLVQIEKWEGEFDLMLLQPLVEKTEKLLRPVLAQIAHDEKAYMDA